jgi:hypothetical protein
VVEGAPAESDFWAIVDVIEVSVVVVRVGAIEITLVNISQAIAVAVEMLLHATVRSGRAGGNQGIAAVADTEPVIDAYGVEGVVVGAVDRALLVSVQSTS